MIRFDAPFWFLAFAFVSVAVVVWRLGRLPGSIRGLRRRLVQASMGLAVLATALAVSGLELGRRLDRLAVVFVVDRSRSVEHTDSRETDPSLEAVRRATESMRADDEAGVVVFGAEAATELFPTPRPDVTDVRTSVAREGTDIAAGIRRALADLPPEHVGRIVLLTDGVETQGDSLRAATVAASRNVPIDVLPIERAPRAELAIEQVRVTPSANPGEPVELRVVTRATVAADAVVRVLRDGVVLAEGRTRISAGEDALVLRDVAPEAGVHRYDVVLDPVDAASDEARENNEGSAYLRVLGAARALVLADEPEQAMALAQAIRATGMRVDVAGPNAIPDDLAALSAYDLIVLSDLSARAFSEDQMAALHAYVRDVGGGLLMVGARRSFGVGGYAYTPIEEALPATFDLRRRRDRMSLAMIIAIDKSGSMSADAGGGRCKLDLANEAASRSAMLLSTSDRVGVMHVDTAIEWTQPMTTVTDPGAIAARVRHASVGGGGILVDVALEGSYRTLRSESTQLKHLLLFSDGSDSEDMGDAERLVRTAVHDRITTSVVSMGNAGDTPELERLSRIGGGRFYIVEDLSQLPRIFTQETIEASRAALVMEPFRAQLVRAAGPTRGIDFASAPALGGHAVVNARGAATRLLAATAQDALLLEWQHGVGRSAVFATDAGAEFGRTWLGWPGYTALFGQLARDLGRPPERRDASVRVTADGGAGRIRVDAVDEGGAYRNYLDLAATVAGPGGVDQRVTLTQTGAGRYEASFDAASPGPYLVTVREGPSTLVATAGVVRERGDELRGEGTDHHKLAQIAAQSGGNVRRSLDGFFRERPPRTYAYDPAWPWLVVLALCAMLASVALRRLVVPRFWAARAPKVAPVAPTLVSNHEVVGSRERRPRENHESAPPNARPTNGTTSTSASTPTEPSPGPPAPPASLAEQLLARKKKK